MKIKSRRSYIAASLIITAGAGLTATGITTESMPEVIAGVSLAISGQLLGSMRLLWTWTTDTRADRQRLNDATAKLDEESAKYAAGLLALDEEHGRVRRDRIAAARRSDEQLRAHREFLEDEFEEKKNELISRTFEVAWRLFSTKGLDAPAARHNVVVPFPQQQPADQEGARARSRDVSP